MTEHLHISSYRLAFWHAPQRARHEDGDVLDCVICQYSEGVALMKDVVAYLRRRGFVIVDFDERSFIVEANTDEVDYGQLSATNQETLFHFISGHSLSFHS